MKALKIATDKNEKSELRSSCKYLIDEAERIKASQQWSSSANIANHQLEVTLPPSTFPNIPAQDIANHSFKLQNPLTSTSNTSVFDSLLEVHTSKSKSKQAANAAPWPVLVHSESDSAQLSHVKEDFEPTNATLPKPQPSALAQLCEIKSSPSTPTTSSNELTARIRKLTEPVSVRVLSQKEEILLLRASKLNGFAFPPWRAPPDSAEFALVDGAEAFMYAKLQRNS